MAISIKAKQSNIREAKVADEIARHQTEMNRRNGFDEIVYSTNTLDIPATEREIARLQVSTILSLDARALEPRKSGLRRSLVLRDSPSLLACDRTYLQHQTLGSAAGNGLRDPLLAGVI